MILQYPEELKGKELMQFLWKEKSMLIKQKKAGIAFGGDFGSGITERSIYLHKEKAIKLNDDGLQSKAIIANNLANLCMWFDYQKDVIVTNAYKKTFSDKAYFFSLKDHGQYTTDIIGDTLSVDMGIFNCAELGIKTQVISCTGPVFKTRITEKTGGLIYEQYKEGLIKNHSIGYRPIHYELALNDPDFKEEYKLWTEYIGQVINRGEAEKHRYMWLNFELALIENSAVVRGANSQTPTISIEESKSKEAVIDTSKATISGAAQSTSNKSILNFYKNL